jgi:hypothetical protein
LATRTISFATSNGFGANIAPEGADRQVEGPSVEIAKVGGVTVLKPTVESVLAGADIACCNQVRRAVDAKCTGTESRHGDRRGSLPASEIVDLQPRCDTEPAHQHL